MAIGHRLGLRLFLEGIEVPVIGANVSLAPDMPAAASIQVIATDQILNLLPRTVVHLFFYDFVDSTFPVNDQGADSLRNVDLLSEDFSNVDYKLLFMGEVQGVSIQKDSSTRAAILSCVDFSNYWDTTYQYNFQGSLLGGHRYAAFIGANANLFTSPLGHGVGTISALLNGKSVNFPNMTGLLAGIIRVLEAIGGSYYGETTFKGANQFTSIAELRLKILQQITAAEDDSSTARLFARKAFNMWMNRSVGGLGQLVTFRGLVQLMQGFIFHNVFPNPAAKYQERVDGLKKTKTWATDITEDPQTKGFVEEIEKLRQLVTSARVSLQRLVDFTNQQDATASAQADLTAARKTTNNLLANTPRVPGLDKYMSAIDALLLKMSKELSSKSGGFVLSSVKLGDAILVRSAIADIGEILTTIAALLGTKIKKQRGVTYSKLERVNNQLFRPDLWFASPPRCNVLFPELYSYFQWSRNFLREVTRLELQTMNEVLGDDQLFNGRYYAPNVADMRSGVRLSSRRFGRLILAHELYTGIIPMFEKMTEANLFAMRSNQVKIKGAKVGYAQRATNFQYFKHRFASRQLTVGGRFNPWFVPGFPALLIDRPMDGEKLAIAGLPIAEQLNALNITPVQGIDITRATLLQTLVPTQYLASCIQLTHSVSQSGGTTDYVLAQARVHRESTEYLGVDKAVVNKKIGTAKRTSVIAALPLSAPKVGNKGPHGGRIVAVKDVTAQYKGRFLTSFGAASSLKIKVGTQFGRESYHAYQIVETFTRYARINVDLPIEDAVRPPWIWDGWANLKIGETYMKLIGTNALTDVDGFASRTLLASLVEQNADVVVDKEVAEGKYFGTGVSGGAGRNTLVPNTEQTRARTNKVSDEDTDVQKSADRRLSAATILSMESERTIENCVDYLVRVYSLIRQYNLDVGAFIRHFTWRPVANMVQILGSADFSITEDPPDSGNYVASGTEGFHSRAYGDVSDLFGLVNPNVKKILGLVKDSATAKRLDVRASRRSVVRAYIEELTNSRGLLG